MLYPWDNWSQIQSMQGRKFARSNCLCRRQMNNLGGVITARFLEVAKNRIQPKRLLFGNLYVAITGNKLLKLACTVSIVG